MKLCGLVTTYFDCDAFVVVVDYVFACVDVVCREVEIWVDSSETIDAHDDCGTVE